MFRLLVVVTVLFMTTDAQMMNDAFSAFMRGFLEVKIRKAKISDDNFPSVRLTNFKNVAYYGTVNIGNPSYRDFKVVFDTSSPYLWIFSKKSTNPIALTRGQYNSTNSFLYIPNNKPFHVRYPDYNVTGFLSIDAVNVAHIFTINQTFMEVLDVSDVNIFDLYVNILDPRFDGLMGLSYSNISVDGITTVFDNMIQRNKVSFRIFSFYINRDPSADFGGKLVLGGSEPNFFKGGLTYVPVTRKGYWQFTIDRIQMNYFTLCEKSCQAIIDSSTWKIIGPELDILRVNHFIGTNQQGRVNCDRISYLPTITFNMGGHAYDLTDKDYIIRHPNDESICITVFWKNESTYKYDVKWVLGLPFMGRYYTEFNMEEDRVGFGLSKDV